MPITFPSNPSDQDEYTFNGRTYTYNASRGVWLGSRGGSVSAGGGGGGAALTVSDTAPTSASEGDLWFHSTLLETYVYYNSVWVLSNPSSGGGSSGGGVTTYADITARDAATPIQGDFAYVTSVTSLYFYDGTAWDRVYVGPEQQLYWTTQPSGLLQLNNDGTSTTVTTAAVDPEGFAVTYGYDLLPSNAAQIASISENNGVFTITPTTNTDNGGEFKIRFRATDGLNVLSETLDGILTFGPAAAGNLIGWYDFSDANSYPGTGATVYDLSGNGNHLDLTGGGSYSYNSGSGYMTFPDYTSNSIGDGFSLGTAFTSSKEIMIVAYFNSGDNYQPILYSAGSTYYVGGFLSGDTVNPPDAAPVHSGETAVSYVNGVEATNRGLGFSSFNLSTFNSVFSSGNDLSTGAWTFKGYPNANWNDQLIVKGWLCWDRVLTNAERQAAHNYWSENRSVSMATWSG